MLGEYARSLKYEDNAKYQVQIDQKTETESPWFLFLMR